MREAWILADEDGNNKLDMDEISNLMQGLNKNIAPYHLKKIFDSFDEDRSGKLDFDEFRKLMDTLNHKPELEEMFNKYAEDNIDFDNKPENKTVITMP